METSSKIEMVIEMRHGVVSSWEKIDDQQFLRQLVDIAMHAPMTAGDLIAHAFKAWLSSPEGQRVVAVVEGIRDIAENGGHDFDGVLDELEAILKGEDDPGDD